jgi:hypothetical protein
MHAGHIEGRRLIRCALAGGHHRISFKVSDEVLVWITKAKNLTDVKVTVGTDQRGADGCLEVVVSRIDLGHSGT